jgi:hypothetical protein
MNPRQMDKKGLIDEATRRIFSLGPRDLASALAYENMRYGLGKMIYAADSLDISCVFGPDATITRNIERWNSGFGYGAVIKWPKSGLAFPEIKPNACGMLLARIESIPSREEIINKISELNSSKIYLDGVEIKPDFGHGNHFFEFYSVLESSPEISGQIDKEHYYVLLHGSAPERKDLIYNHVNNGSRMQTPLGKVAVLDGGEAKDYYSNWKKLEDFSIRRREFILKQVLGEYEVVSNLTHQGLFAENEIRLGCYDSMQKTGKGKTLFPVALRWDMPVYIFKGRKNLSEEVIGRLGFTQRAQELGLTDTLKETNILPHGGGYKVDLEYTKISVVQAESGNHFVLHGAKPASRVSEMIETSKKGVSSFGEMVIMNPRELPYDYRGLAVVEKTMEYSLGDPVAKLQPLMTLKI